MTEKREKRKKSFVGWTKVSFACSNSPYHSSVKVKCPNCLLIIKVGDCEPDIDGDGNLGCPRCLVISNKKVVMKEA